MRRVRVLLSFACLTIAAACASSGSSTSSASASASPSSKPWYEGRPVPRTYLPATRSWTECAEVRQRAATLGDGTHPGLRPAMVGVIVILPMPMPPDIRNLMVTIRMRADAFGNVMKDSVWVDGIGDHPYVHKVKKSAEGYKIWPAVMEECAVSARVSMRAGTSASR